MAYPLVVFITQQQLFAMGEKGWVRQTIVFQNHAIFLLFEKPADRFPETALLHPRFYFAVQRLHLTWPVHLLVMVLPAPPFCLIGRPALGASAATYNRAGLIARICSKTCSVVSGLQILKQMGILYISLFSCFGKRFPQYSSPFSA